ncbi:MAG: hypothetical protein ACOZNI_37300 [Myxococcota bacterium]
MVQALSLVVTLVSEASACPNEELAARSTQAASVDAGAASHSAKSAALIGSNCSYTTGMIARRVVDEGQDWSWRGVLADAKGDLTSQVAAPFVANGARIVANELVELIVDGGHGHARLAFVGKSLDIDGVRYVVITSFEVLSS